MAETADMSRVELTAPPNTTSLFAKAALGALPGPSRPKELPDTELVLPGQTVDRDHLAAYSRVCGFALSDRLPLTYPHVLGFGLSMQLMAGRDFPFPLIGLVHIANRITRYREIGADERLDLRVRAGGLAPHERGSQFVVTMEAAVDGEAVWAGESTYLRRGGSGGEPAAAGTSQSPAQERPDEPTALWRLPEDIGRRYAAVSGDVNPIHLHWLTARPLGFRRAIAHGMYTKARSVAAVAPRLPGACTVAVRFGRPVLLPATVEFSAAKFDAAAGETGWDLAVRSRKGKPHLTGTAVPATAG
jgi:acyl dehydratase